MHAASASIDHLNQHSPFYCALPWQMRLGTLVAGNTCMAFFFCLIGYGLGYGTLQF